MEQIILPGVLQSLKGMEDFLAHHSEKAGLDKKKAVKLRLAVDEIVTNTILHGYEEQGLKGNVTLKAQLKPETLTIVTEDTAPPFDPRTLAKPESLDQSVEERPIGGLGVYLMLKSIDHYEYAHVDGKNRNTFVINRHPGHKV